MATKKRSIRLTDDQVDALRALGDALGIEGKQAGKNLGPTIAHIAALAGRNMQTTINLALAIEAAERGQFIKPEKAND